MLRLKSSQKVFVGGVKEDITEQEIGEAFTKFGEVTRVQIVVNQQTGQRRGFSFVSFLNRSSCSAAIQEGKVYIRNNRLNVKRCKPNLEMFTNNLQ